MLVSYILEKEEVGGDDDADDDVAKDDGDGEG